MHVQDLHTLSQGRFSLAAKYHMTIGEIYENELVDLERVSECKLQNLCDLHFTCEIICRL